MKTKRFSLTGWLVIVLLIGQTKITNAQEHLQLNTYSGQSVIKASKSITLKPGVYIPSGSTVRIYIDESPVVCTTPPGSADQNYILTAKVKVAGLTTEAAVDSALCDPAKVNATYQYFDGLGREMQTVQYKGSPEGNDMIQPKVYDDFGRENKQYLPYSSPTANGTCRSSALTDQATFFNSPPTGVTGIPSGSGQVAYSETKFEASNLDRVQEQGFPGGAWKIGGGHTQRRGYGFNGTSDVRYWTVTSTGASGTGYYAKSTLHTDTLTDEDGYKTITYTDVDKKVIFKRVQDASGYLGTYYVYDELDHLRYVIPPGFSGTSFLESDTTFEQFIYAYRYTGKGLVQEKKIPGKGWEYLVYNRLDELVMSQDANQRTKAPQEWTIFKYDELGRQVLSAVYSHSGSSANTSYLSAQQAAVDANSYLWETSTTTGTGYTANTYPTSWDRTLTINYFDSYVIPGKTSTYNATQTVTARVQGLATGSKVNILGTSTLLLTINYYDEKGRLKESIADNHLSGTDRIVNTWNFADELTASTHNHTSSGGSVSIASRFEYDHAGRKTKTYQKIGSDAEVLLSEIVYNELGQAYTKTLHGGQQSITHGYNSRGWLTQKSAPLFAMQLKYNDGTTPRYNGNITNQLWGTPGSLGNTFTYSYDPLNRLTAGDTGTGTYEKDISYDVMGNITSLNRNGTGTQTYSYSGNRLSSVSGGISRSYTYDANGNALTDGTNTLTYNMLNLPATVSGGASITYTYDATTRKLKRVSGGATTDYVGEIQYTGGAIDFIQTEEGLARKSGSNYLYEYALTDHLGNNRLEFDIYGGTTREVQHDSYYPFGKTFGSYASGARNNYLYNSKELQGGLEQYDYGARFYDSVVGRWNVVDPMADAAPELTPFRYCYNSPVNYIDPYGLYEYDLYGNITMTNPSEISSFINSFGKNGITPTTNNMTNFVIQNFALDLHEVTVKGKSNYAFSTAGSDASKYQEEALKRAKLDGSVFYGVNVFATDIFSGSDAGTLPGIGIFLNKEHMTDYDLLKHEFGHVLQAKKYGLSFFYKTILPNSLYSGYLNQTRNNFDHHDTWTEWSANDLSKDYFKNEAWNTKRFPLLPKHVRMGIYPNMKPTTFYSGGK
jgi:RHS repeat-associated protein